MIAVALKGVAARKVRTLLTSLAVVTGVAMVSGTLILTDTMRSSFDQLIAANYDGTDAVVRGREIVKGSSTGAAAVPESLLAKVRALPEVAAAGGIVAPENINATSIIGRDGEAVARQSMGMSVDAANPRFNSLQLTAGDWPAGPGEVVIDAGTAERGDFAVGDTVGVTTPGRKGTYRLAGTVSVGDVGSLGLWGIAAWDVETAQRLLDRKRSFDSLSLAVADGVSTSELVAAVRPLVPDGLEVTSSARQAARDAEEIDEGMAYVRYFLLGFSGVALFVGAFVILNALSITVAQRTREFATLRTLGASRRQVLWSVRIEGLLVGLLASTTGLFLGLGLAEGMLALFAALGLKLPEASTVFALRTVIASLVVGTGVTLLATLVPARRATRVPPIAAVREGSSLPASRLAGHSVKAGVAAVGASVGAIAVGSFAGGLSLTTAALLLGLGLLGLFAGIAVLAPRLVKPLARLVGWPARIVGGLAGELAGANASRNPGRTASTAAALMIGLALVTVVAVLASGLRASTESAITDQLRADYVVDGKDGLPFSAAGGEALARVRGVTAASHVRGDRALVNGEETGVTGIDPATIGRFYTFDWTAGGAGAVERLGVDGALVTHDYADDQELSVGSRLAIQSPMGGQRTVVVRAIYDPPAARPLLQQVSIGQAAFDETFPTHKNAFTFLAARPGADDELAAAATGLGDATLHTGAAFPKDATKDMVAFLAMLYVLLAFSVIVSLFGMVNTLVLSVFERTRELGLLRAIGMTRRQARRMIRHESVITALIGAALGLGLGLFVAALFTRALSEFDIPMSLPAAELAAFTAVAVLAGIAAAVLPARRASRLNVLEALHYE